MTEGAPGEVAACLKRLAPAAAAAFVCALALRIPVSDVPLSDNEAAIAVIADQMSRGSRLYRDLYEIKPPAGFVLARLAAGGAIDDASMRRLGGIAAAVTAGCAALAAGLAAGTAAAWVAGLLAAAFLLTAAGAGWATNPDLVAAPFVAAAYVAVLLPWRRAVPWLAVGALFGVAAAVKQTAALHLVWIVAWRFAVGDASASIRLLGGALAAGALTWVAAGRPDLDAMVFWVWTTNFRYVEVGWNYRKGVGAIGTLDVWSGVLREQAPLLLAALFAWRKDALRASARVPLAGWLLGAAVPILSGGWAYAYWYVTLVPSLAVATACAWTSGSGRRVAWAVGAGGLLLAALPIASAVRMYVLSTPSGIRESVYSRDADFDTEMQAGRHVRTNAAPGDRIHAFGGSPVLYWESRLEPATPWIWPDLRGYEPPGSRSPRERLLDDPPEWVAVVRQKRAVHAETIRGLLATGYAPDATFSGKWQIDLWRRAPARRSGDS